MLDGLLGTVPYDLVSLDELDGVGDADLNTTGYDAFQGLNIGRII